MPQHEHNRHDYDTVVIGAGFAGLTAARDLRAAGETVLVLEARERIGGSTWYRPEAFDGFGLEMGGTWIVPQQTHVFTEADRYGIAITEDAVPSRLTWSEHGTVRESLLPVDPDEYGQLEHAVRTLAAASDRIDPDRPLSKQHVSDLDVPIREWAEKNGLSGNAGQLMISWFCGCANAHEDTGSALDVLRWMAAMEHSLWGMIQASVLGCTFTHGTVSLATAIADDSGAELRLSSPVHRIAADEHGVTVTADRVGAVRAGRVVVTVPIGVLGDIDFDPPLSEAKRAASRENHAGQGQKIWALARHVASDLSGFGWGTAFDYVGALGSTDRGEVLVCFAPEHDRVDAEDLTDVQQAVREFAPEAVVLEASTHRWVDDPYSKGTWATFRAGQFGKYETALARPEGRVHFAGSHTARRWRAFIDGAIESGTRVAADIRHAANNEEAQ